MSKYFRPFGSFNSCYNSASTFRSPAREIEYNSNSLWFQLRLLKDGRTKICESFQLERSCSDFGCDFNSVIVSMDSSSINRLIGFQSKSHQSATWGETRMGSPNHGSPIDDRLKQKIDKNARLLSLTNTGSRDFQVDFQLKIFSWHLTQEGIVYFFSHNQKQLSHKACAPWRDAREVTMRGKCKSLRLG